VSERHVRIAVITPTYYRPRQLITAVSSLHDTRSHKHEIVFAIGLDADDHDGRRAVEFLLAHGLPVICVVAPEPPTLGEKTNGILKHVEADAYAWIADDVIPMAQHWDSTIAAVFAGYRVPAFCWNELNDPGNTTYPVVTRRLLDALEGRLFDEWFPLWFVDTWLAEVCYFAFGERLRIVKELVLGGTRGYPTVAHDLPYWFRFFALTRGERVAQAQRVAQAFGLEVNVASDRRKAISECVAWDAMQRARVPHYVEALRGGIKDPPPRYWIARTRADAHLARLDLHSSADDPLGLRPA